VTVDASSHSHSPFVGYWIGLPPWIFGDGPRLHNTVRVAIRNWLMLPSGGAL